MRKTIFGIIVCFLLSACFATAASPDYEIDKVLINGMLITDEKLSVELGTKLQIDVWIKGTGEKKDVKLKAWVGGYEYEDVQAMTEAFEVNNGISYRKELFLDIPRDLRLNSNDYKLHIEVFDRNNYEEKTYTLFIEERRHDIAITDVIQRPGTTIDAGKTLMIQTRLENFGQKNERNIKLEVSIPSLSTTSSTWIDLLEKGNSLSSSFLPLQIPIDAKTGDYQIVIKAIYNNLHTEVVAKRLVYVRGVEETKAIEAEKTSIVSIAFASKGNVFDTVTAKVAVANIGKMRKNYKIVVEAGDWANINVEPSYFAVEPGSGNEAIVTLQPQKAGLAQYSIKVFDGEYLIKEQQVNFLAIEKGAEKQFGINSIKNLMNKDFLKDRRNLVLIIMIVVLLFALVITLAIGTKQHVRHRFE